MKLNPLRYEATYVGKIPENALQMPDSVYVDNVQNVRKGTINITKSWNGSFHYVEISRY